MYYCHLLELHCKELDKSQQNKTKLKIENTQRFQYKDFFCFFFFFNRLLLSIMWFKYIMHNKKSALCSTIICILKCLSDLILVVLFLVIETPVLLNCHLGGNPEWPPNSILPSHLPAPSDL